MSANELVASNLNDWNTDFKAERDALKELLKLPSVWKDMVAFEIIKRITYLVVICMK